MSWLAVWRTADGALVSTGTVIANPLPAGLSSTSLGENPPSGDGGTGEHVPIRISGVERVSENLPLYHWLSANSPTKISE
jgi:hypothetical protein